jgi:putative addiction module component (TIGR02574 family)
MLRTIFNAGAGTRYSLCMRADELRREALALPVDERAALAKDLLLSLDEGDEPGAEDAWAEELGQRAQAVADGTATLVDWADAEKRISARLKARREARATR